MAEKDYPVFDDTPGGKLQIGKMVGRAKSISDATRVYSENGEKPAEVVFEEKYLTAYGPTVQAIEKKVLDKFKHEEAVLKDYEIRIGWTFNNWIVTCKGYYRYMEKQ